MAVRFIYQVPAQCPAEQPAERFFEQATDDGIAAPVRRFTGRYNGFAFGTDRRGL